VELHTRGASFHVEEHEMKDGAATLRFAASKRPTIMLMLGAPLSSSSTLTLTADCYIFLKIRMRIVQYCKGIILAAHGLCKSFALPATANWSSTLEWF
jgi:hypothetical protein